MKSLTCFSSRSRGICSAVILERLAENCRGRTTAIICTRTNAPKYILESPRLHFGSICDQNGRNFEPCREGYVGSRKSLQEGAAHCGGGAIAGGGSTRVLINAKIQFEKPLHCSCVFRRNQISAARRVLEGGGNFDCATGIRVDTVINRTDKTLSVSKTALSHILWS